MLERTAGRLEPGSLRRLLPASKKPLRSRRTLHSTFWSHCAVDIAVPSLWSTLVRAAPATGAGETPINPKGVLLDFLYPTATLNFLRTHSNWGAGRRDGRWLRAELGTLGQRQYTSSAKDPSPPADEDPSFSKADTKSAQESINAIPRNKSLKPLYQKLGLARSYDYEEAWRKYRLLGADEQKNLYPQLLEYLSTSARAIDAGRTLELFEALVPGERNRQDYSYAIRSYLGQDNFSGAIRLHKLALESLDYPSAGPELFAYLLYNSSWLEALSVWKGLKEWQAQHQSAEWLEIYKSFDTLPDIGTIAFKLGEYVNKRLNSSDVEASNDTSELINFASKIGRQALRMNETFNSTHFRALLQNLQNWGADMFKVYEQSIKVLLEHNETKLAVQCYWKARKLEGSKFSRQTLEAILQIFCKYHSVVGVQRVLDDFFEFYNRPTRRVYRLCMEEFARQGDAYSVHALFDQFSARFHWKGTNKPHLLEKPDKIADKDKTPSNSAFKNADDITPILIVHARRGEIQEVKNWFNKLQDFYNLTPTISCWNILISAYGKILDVDAAYDRFQDVLAQPFTKPDDYTFGTMMGICAMRGDLQAVLELYNLAEKMNIKKSAAMIDCIVSAHIQDSDLERAEHLCEEALHMNLKGSITRMWNYLLTAHALKRDLPAVNRILQRMTTLNIEYDQYTYSALMQALAVAGQSDSAYIILKDVLPKAGIRANAFHYAVVMGGYLANGEVHKIARVNNRMLRHSVGRTASTNLMVLKKEIIQDMRAWEDGLVTGPRLETAMEIFRALIASMDPQDISLTPRKGGANIPLNYAHATMLYNYIMAVLAQENEFETVDLLFADFLQFVPESERDKVPVSVLSALMISHFQQGDHQGVRKCWDLAFIRAKEQGQRLPPLDTRLNNPDKFSPKILPIKEGILRKHQLALMRPLMIYLRSLFYQRKVDEMIATVESFMAEGFTMDNKNWNLYVEFLVRSYRYRLAFQICEAQLMQNWTGWAWTRRHAPMPNQLPLELRNKRKDPRHLRPLHNTLLYLARGYLDLQTMYAEAGPSELILEDLRKRCPNTVAAVITMPRSGDLVERKILGQEY